MTASAKTIVGACAYNEENNIGNLLQNLTTKQELPEDSQILVICSGCTDRTPEIVQSFGENDSRIILITEKTRLGKAHALNSLFAIARKSAEVLVLTNADAIPGPRSITTLLSRLRESRAGAVFAQPIPNGVTSGLCSRIVNVIWRLHHVISLLQRPKFSGELCAIYTRYLQDLPANVATDEPYIELSLCKHGLHVLYVPESVVYIRCPTNVVDLLRHRKRIWTGHKQLQNVTGVKVSTSSFLNVLMAMPALRVNEIFYASIGAFLEMIAYIGAKIALSQSTIPYVWEPIRTTKT